MAWLWGGGDSLSQRSRGSSLDSDYESSVIHNEIPLLSKLNNYSNGGTMMGVSGQEIGKLVSGYGSLADLLPDTDDNAILEPHGRSAAAPQLPPPAGINISNDSEDDNSVGGIRERLPLSHRSLRKYVSKEFDLTKFGIPHGARVGIIIPNGPELAVCIISVVNKWCAAPINPANTWQEIKAELESMKAQAIIIQSKSPHESALYAAGALSIGVLELVPSEDVCGLFSLKVVTKPTISNSSSSSSSSSSSLSHYSIAKTVPGFVSFDHPETVLLLHTSGTSGTKKLVPYSLDMLIVGVGCIVSSWNLTPSDVCLNMMRK